MSRWWFYGSLPSCSFASLFFLAELLPAWRRTGKYAVHCLVVTQVHGLSHGSGKFVSQERYRSPVTQTESSQDSNASAVCRSSVLRFSISIKWLLTSFFSINGFGVSQSESLCSRRYSLTCCCIVTSVEDESFVLTVEAKLLVRATRKFCR